MVLTAVGLVVVAILVLVAARATLGSEGSSPSSASRGPAVADADHLQAQQSLSQALQTVSTLSATAGAQSSGADGSGAVPGDLGAGSADAAGTGVTVAQLQSAEPSLDFVTGPSSRATTVSVATGSGGAVTLATMSSDGVCWLVWHSPGQSTWYGAQSGASSCQAPELASPPVAGAVSSTSIGWQTGAFPSA
jgi:hypothetical protein